MGMRKFLPARAALDKRVSELLGFVRFINKFRRIKRLIWYKDNEERELNGEHVFQLEMVAWFIQQRHLPHLNLLKIFLYCKAHDLPEIYAGDTPAFQGPGEYASKLSRATKKQREQKAIASLEREWEYLFPSLLKNIHAYEKQADEESRFVNALDKFLAELNIFEDNGRTDLRLQLSLDEKIAYKRPRIASHPFLLELYDEFCKFCEHRPELFFQPEQLKTAT